MRSIPLLCAKKIGAAGLALVMGVQSLFAYRPEKNYWDQRRTDRSSTRAGALVSRAVSPRSPSPWGDQLPPVQAFRPSLSPSLERSVPKPFLEKNRALLNALSPVYGTVRKVFPAPRSAIDRVVVHIQDVHHNAEAQSNIRGAVADLLKSGRVGVVALEGSSEPIDLQPFADFPHRQPVELAADWLLKENKISGPIHAALTFQGRLPRLVGVDDEKHHAANVQAVRDSARQAGGVRHTIEIARRKLEVDKSRVFSADLSALDKTVNDYRAERIPLGAYVDALTARASAGGRAFRSVDLFLKAFKIERSLDFQQVERERKQLVEKLTQTLTASEIDGLLAESAAYRSGGRLFGAFYAGLTDLCRRKGVALFAFPAMDEYVRYALLADGIQSEQLLTEIGLLEKAAYEAVVRSSAERALVDRSRRLWLASRLVDFALTPPEWEEWGKAKGEFDLDSFEAFYREAQARDKAIAENVGNALADAGVAVLVTGGFHAEGVARLLEQQGVSVISFVPKLTKVDLAQGSSYLSVFSQEKTPLEKLFQGEKLFLSTNPIAKEVHRIQLPVVVTLLGMLLAAQIDPQLTYALLGGLGQIKDVVAGSGLAQALVVVGAGALVFRVFSKGGKVQVESSPAQPGFATSFKIKFWDPVREQVLYFFPAVILVPSLLTLLVTTTFGGGVVMALVTFYFFGGFGVAGVLWILMWLEHKGYTPEQKSYLIVPVLTIAGLTVAGFLVSLLLLSPSVGGLVVHTDQFFPWMPAGEGKAFFLSALVGNLLGVWKHFAHNEKTFGNFLKWQNNENFTGLMPLSISGARSKPKVRPAFSKTPINLPNNVDRTRMLKAFTGAARSALMGNTADPRAVKTLINGIVEYNPSFAKANKHLLDDTEGLSQDPALVQRIINRAIFSPLGAIGLDFESVIDIDHSSWEGFHYLGDKIWLVSPLEGLRHESLNMFFGVGLKPTIDYLAYGANVIKLFLKKRPEDMNETERNNAVQWAQIMGQAYEQRNRWILMQMLKDYTFYRRRPHEEGFPPEPFAKDVAKVITKNNSRFSWDKYSRTAPAFVNARLSGWIQGLVFLLENDNPYLGHLFTKAQLHSISLERKNNGGPMDALGDIMRTVDFSSVEDLIRQREDKRAMQKAISLIKALQDENFLTFEERHQIVYGKLPGNRPEHAIVTKDGADSLAVIPQASTQEAKPLVSQTLSPVAPISQPQASPSAATENSMPDNGEVVNAQSPPPLLGPLESLETIGQLSGAISTLEYAKRRGDSDKDLEAIQDLRVRLLQMVRESGRPATELKTNAEVLGLNSDDILFLDRYLEQQKKRLNPSFGYVVDGMNDDGEQSMLDAYVRLVKLLGNGNLLPLSFDEGVEEIFDTEFSEGGLAPFYDKGYRVVVFKDHYDKNVAKNNLVQKVIVNVVRNLIDFQETASPGQSRIVRDSRGGLSQRGVHKKKSSGQKVFVKFMGEKTLVVLWVDAENEAHGRQSFTANKEVDRRIASQVDNLPNERDKYVALGPDFSVDETADLSQLLQNPQTGNGVGASTGGKATSLWLLKLFEFVGGFKGEGGREAFGDYYAANAAKIEPWVGGIVAVASGFVGLLRGGDVGLVWGVAGMLFFLSHWIPQSIKPVTEVKVSLPKAFLLAVLYGTLMAVSPQTFINLANDFSLIAAISFLGTFVVWYLTFRLHAWFDGKDGKTNKRTKAYYPDRIIGAKSYPSERGDRSVRQSAAVHFQYFLNKLAELQNENGHSERNFSFKNFEQWSYKHPPQVPKNLGNLILMIHGELMRTFPDYKRRFSEKWGRGKGIKPHDVLVFWSRNRQMSLTRPAENPDDDLTGTTIDLNNANRLRIAKRIGGGAYGIAFLATDALDKSYLVKTVNHPHPRMPLTTALGDIGFILHEGNILNRVSGVASGSGADSLPPVPQFYGYSLTRGAKIAIVSEFIEGSSLHDVVFNAEDPNHLNFEMAADIVDVVDRLHELGIVHGDIKADNIIIDADNQPRLIDFGSALQYRDSQGYVSNETLNSDLASLASDQAWNHYGFVFSKSDFDFYRLWLMFDSTLPFFKDLSPLLKEISTEPERLLERARVLSDPFQRDVFQLWENLRSRYFSDVLLPRNLSSSQKARAVKDWLNVAEIRIMKFRNEQIDRRIRAKPAFPSAQTGSLSNSLLYLWSGRPGLGGVGAGGEAVALLWVASILGGVGMGFFLLPLFSLAHVWIIARQNPGMSVAQRGRQFMWHWLLALPYALIGLPGLQDVLGGETAVRIFAVAWHLLTDIVFMVQDQIAARKAARGTLDLLLPPAESLLIEQVGGSRFRQDVRPQLARPGFARAYEKALARELSQRWRGSLPTSPDGLVEWLESSFTGTPATAESQNVATIQVPHPPLRGTFPQEGKENKGFTSPLGRGQGEGPEQLQKVYVQAVAGEDLDDVLRSAEIVREWAEKGAKTPRLVLAAKDAAVLAKLRAVARPGVVDVVEKTVTDPNGVLVAALLLDSLNQFRIPPSARLSVMVSPSITVNESALELLPDSELARRLREALLVLLKGDPIRHHEFRTFLEVASAVLKSA